MSRPVDVDAMPSSKAPVLASHPENVSTQTDWFAAALLAVGFCWRVWLAHATFFSPDEAWHFSLANRESVRLAYNASLTISHPPLLILILHFWRVLGTSNLVLRLPSVIAGTVFCWIFYRWLGVIASRAVAIAGLILVCLLGPMIVMSAEVRQYPLLLMFSAAAAWLFELALSPESSALMLASSACLCLAMLSHYSAFFVAAALGAYAILRILQQRPSLSVLLSWIGGQIVGIAVAGFLYKTHLGRLNALLYQALLPQQYLSGQYFHPASDHLLPYLYRGTFGIFRFVLGQTQIGQLAVLLFIAGAIFLLRQEQAADRSRRRAFAILLLLPFFLNWLAAAAGFYPYGRMRQCLFLAIPVLAGVSVCVARSFRERVAPSAALALLIVVLCHALGTPQDRDELPLADQRHQHMDQAIEFIRSHVAPEDVILTDKASSYQLAHYLCDQKPVQIESTDQGNETFGCRGLRVISTGPTAGQLTPQNLIPALATLHTSGHIWIVQAAWAHGLGESIRSESPAFTDVELHTFGRFIEVFKMPPIPTHP